MVADRSIYCIKVKWEVEYRKFAYVVSTTFLPPVWPDMAVGGLFSPVIHALRCVVANRLAQSATGPQPTTGILFMVQREVNIRRRRSPGVLFCHPEAFGLLTCEFRRQYLRFRQTGSGYLLTGSSFLYQLHLHYFVHIAGAHACRD